LGEKEVTTRGGRVFLVLAELDEEVRGRRSEVDRFGVEVVEHSAVGGVAADEDVSGTERAGWKKKEKKENWPVTLNIYR
jgi:hypothetical protein